jgi:hypothetical protein
MFKKFLSLRQKKSSEGAMSAAHFVDQSVHAARVLIEREARGPGDVENAMRRLEQRYGLSFNDLWRLRYRPPKRIFADIYARLQHAVEAHRNEQIRKLQHEVEIARVLLGDNDAAVRAGEAALGAVSRAAEDKTR